MELIFIIFAIIMTILIILSHRKSNDKSSVLVMRKQQSISRLRENALKKKFEKIAENKAKVSDKYKIETNCLQAGFRISYGEYKIISIATSIIVPIIVLTITNNILLSLIFIIVGHMIPGEIITFRKNKRVGLMEKQAGSFMKLTIERYKSQKDFSKAVKDSLIDFKGQEPIYAEIKQTVLDMELGIPTTEAMDGLARRTGNKYLQRLSDYYKIASQIGTQDSRENLLNQAFNQYEENRKLKSILKKEISGPVREAYIMLGAIPMMIIYQIFTSDTYLDFMLHSTVGKIGSAVIVAIMMGAVWFINAKIGSPID